MEKVITYKDKSYIVRDNTTDRQTVVERTYSKNCTFTKDDVWLDLGANVGAFSVKFSDTVRKMYAYEPDPTNYEMLVRNLELNAVQNIKPFQSAVVGTDIQHIDLFCSDSSKWGQTIFPVRGRQAVKVKAENIEDILKSFPDVNKIKMDVEGAEGEILLANIDFNGISELILEWHFSQRRDHENDYEEYNRVCQILRENFDTITGMPEGKMPALCTIHCKKS